MTLRYAKIDRGETQVLLDDEQCAILVERKFCDRRIGILDYRARNLRILSEHMSDTLGYGPAVELLRAWKIDVRSDLWTLNHKGGTNHFTDR